MFGLRLGGQHRRSSTAICDDSRDPREAKEVRPQEVEVEGASRKDDQVARSEGPEGDLEFLEGQEAGHCREEMVAFHLLASHATRWNIQVRQGQKRELKKGRRSSFLQRRSQRVYACKRAEKFKSTNQAQRTIFVGRSRKYCEMLPWAFACSVSQA